MVIFAVWHFRPLVGVELISSGATRHGGQATVVPTGVLPVKIHALHHAAGAAVLAPGQVGTVHASSLDARGHVSFVVSPHLYGWWWLLLATWPLPLLAGLMRRPGGEGGLSVA